MKISFVATVFNEEKTVVSLLDSLFKQTKMPDEIVIVDGGSRDGTVSTISEFTSEESKSKLSHHPRWVNKKIKFIALIKKGNRAVGRNEAIKNATGDIIVCSDAGCILDKDWVKNITEPFKVQKTDIVAGYYKGIAKTIFQKCLIPYVLVMEDKVDPENFLPASRSMAFKKLIWERVGGFPEDLSHNEDYAFANKLKEINARMVFEKDAIVYWTPRENLKEAFIMFFRFALGDVESGIVRPKVILLFSRYLTGLGLVVSFLVLKLPLIVNTLLIILVFYIAWSILKNFKYVSHWEAIIYLPLLQLTSDIAVLLGTSWGLLKSLI